jgi:hypothetical protein
MKKKATLAERKFSAYSSEGYQNSRNTKSPNEGRRLGMYLRRK